MNSPNDPRMEITTKDVLLAEGVVIGAVVVTGYLVKSFFKGAKRGYNRSKTIKEKRNWKKFEKNWDGTYWQLCIDYLNPEIFYDWESCKKRYEEINPGMKKFCPIYCCGKDFDPYEVVPEINKI